MSETDLVPEDPTGSGTGRRVRLGVVSRFIDLRERDVTEVAGHEILTLAVDGELYAVGNRCTHRPFWLDKGVVPPGTREITCPLHGGRFCLRTGKATAPPCTEPIPTYPVTVVEGVVYVELPAGP